MWLQHVTPPWCQPGKIPLLLGSFTSGEGSESPVLRSSTAPDGDSNLWAFLGYFGGAKPVGSLAPEQQTWLRKRTIGESYLSKESTGYPWTQKGLQKEGTWLKEQGSWKKEQPVIPALAIVLHKQNSVGTKQNNCISPSKSFSPCFGWNLVQVPTSCSVAFNYLKRTPPVSVV